MPLPNTLRPGSSGQAVRDLQAALNARLIPNPQLGVTGHYDSRTQNAVRRYQRQVWLAEDGIAGACTQNALFDREGGPPILHNVRYLRQPTPTSCWAAAVAMMKGTSVNAVRLATPVGWLLPDGSLRNESDTPGSTTLHRAFAGTHGLRYHQPMCWLISGLVRLLRSGPFMMEALWDARGYAAGTGSSGHYVVVIGARGTFTEDATTTLRIYDPESDANGGGIFSSSYAVMMRRVPMATYGIFTR